MKIGSSNIGGVYLGSDEVSKMYLGSEEVWSATPSTPNYLCFTALESGTFTLSIGSGVSTTNLSYIEYSTDEGETWTKTNNVDSTAVVITTPTISTGGTVLWRGSGVSMSVSTNTTSETGDSVFSSTGNFDISGHICSLFYAGNSSSYSSLPSGSSTFFGMFKNATKLKNAKDLILPNDTKDYCYKRFMTGCSGLLTAPVFPATSVSSTQCYNATFYNCTSLQSSPYIKATTGSGNYLCQQMFYGCSSMNYIKVMFKTRPSSSAFTNWASGVASTGIFVKHIDATWSQTGASGVPDNWTVIYYDDSTNKYYLSDKTTECDDHGNVL